MDRFKRYSDRETLERIIRWPQLMHRFPRIRIYSAEHQAFWRGSGNGYTDDATVSDIWDCVVAFERTKHCGPEKRIQFVGV